MRIDSHQHFTREYSPDLLYPILRRNRFDGTVLVEPRGADIPAATLAASYDFILAFVVWADLSSPFLPHALDELQRHPKFRGVWYDFEESPFPKGLGEIALRDLSLDLPARPELVPQIAEHFPGLRLVLDHVGRPSLMPRQFDAWALNLEAAARHSPLCAKISGLITGVEGNWRADDFRDPVQQTLSTLGPDRVLYGSDWPSYLPERTWKEALAAFTQSTGALPAEIRECLLGTNAARFYRLETGDAA